MTKEMQFFIFLLEQYANDKDMLTGEVLKSWDDHQLTQRIYDNYWSYHTEAIENAFRDIDSMLATGKSAW